MVFLALPFQSEMSLSQSEAAGHGVGFFKFALQKYVLPDWTLTHVNLVFVYSVAQSHEGQSMCVSIFYTRCIDILEKVKLEIDIFFSPEDLKVKCWGLQETESLIDPEIFLKADLNYLM